MILKNWSRKIKEYNFDGIAAILSSSPAYVKPSQEGIFRHYAALADVCPIPIIICIMYRVVPDPIWNGKPP
jgi:dihydrodipicolinate synthase/N-acetylneuraminate lyase